MKTILILFYFAVCSTLTAKAQFFNSSRVPEAVKNVFRIEYPKAKHVNWSKVLEGYQAKFEFHHNALLALYDRTGKSLVEATAISKIKLPHLMKKQLRENYTTFAIESVVKIKTIDGKVTFEALIGRAEEAYDLLFNASGYLLMVEPVAEQLAEK